MLNSCIEIGVGPMPGFEDWASMPRNVVKDMWEERGTGVDIFEVEQIIERLVWIERRDLFNWMCMVTAIHGESNPDVTNLMPVLVRRYRMGNEQIRKAKEKWGQAANELDFSIAYWKGIQE